MPEHDKHTRITKNTALYVVLAVAMYATGILVAIISNTSSALSFSVVALVLPTVVLVLFIALYLFIRYWYIFWFSWAPKWLTYKARLPASQILVVYTTLCIILGLPVLVLVLQLIGVLNAVFAISLYVLLCALCLKKLSVLLERTPGNRVKAMTFLGLHEKPSKQQLLSSPGKSVEDIKKTITYKKLLPQNPELPAYESLESQLYACLQSYASLQQGNDTEDSRIDRVLRASIMSLYLSLAANNYTRTFLLSEFSLTHIQANRRQGDQSVAKTTYAFIVYANVSESVRRVNSTEQEPSPHSIRTPFFIECCFDDKRPIISKIELIESFIEKDRIYTDLSNFANKSGLLYSSYLAHPFVPVSGLLTNNVIAPGKTYASNLLSGHTASHIYYLLSMQAYSRIGKNSSYVIGCTIITKTHDRIIVAEKGSNLFKQAELLPIQRVSTESSNFSSRFGIFIGQESSVPSLELLNANFMQLLLDVPFEINIEVINRYLYVYLPTLQISAKDFNTVFAVMRAAQKELRL